MGGSFGAQERGGVLGHKFDQHLDSPRRLGTIGVRRRRFSRRLGFLRRLRRAGVFLLCAGRRRVLRARSARFGFLLTPLLANSFVAYFAFGIEQATVDNFKGFVVLWIRQEPTPCIYGVKARLVWDITVSSSAALGPAGGVRLSTKH